MCVITHVQGHLGKEIVWKRFIEQISKISHEMPLLKGVSTLISVIAALTQQCKKQSGKLLGCTVWKALNGILRSWSDRQNVGRQLLSELGIAL